MSRHHLKITAGQMAAPGTVVIELDGQQIQGALTSLDYHLRAGEPITAILEVFAPASEVDVTAEVQLSEETAVLLKRLGWTPPPGGVVK